MLSLSVTLSLPRSFALPVSQSSAPVQGTAGGESGWSVLLQIYYPSGVFTRYAISSSGSNRQDSQRSFMQQQMSKVPKVPKVSKVPKVPKDDLFILLQQVLLHRFVAPSLCRSLALSLPRSFALPVSQSSAPVQGTAGGESGWSVLLQIYYPSGVFTRYAISSSGSNRQDSQRSFMQQQMSKVPKVPKVSKVPKVPKDDLFILLTGFAPSLCRSLALPLPRFAAPSLFRPVALPVAKSPNHQIAKC